MRNGLYHVICKDEHGMVDFPIRIKGSCLGPADEGYVNPYTLAAALFPNQTVLYVTPFKEGESLDPMGSIVVITFND